MLRKFIGPIAVAATLLSAPAAAEEPNEQDMFAALVQAFPVEPLTAEQTARLPLAAAIVEKIIPPGSMQEVMGSMFDGLLNPLMASVSEPNAMAAADLLGVDAEQLDLADGQAAEIVRIVDPAYEERAARTAKVMPEMMNRMMAAAEPGMRKAMSESYAIYFDERELADIGAFFDTPTGTAYARKSLAMSSDPRFLGAMMQSAPEMMAGAFEMEVALAAAVADLPPAKSYDDLTADERARLAELTGLDAESIRAAMEPAAFDD